MKTFPSSIYVLFFLLFFCACKKDKPQAVSPIAGNWNLAYQTDSILTIPVKTKTVVRTDMLHGSIQFKTDGSFYKETSFTIGTYLYGSDILFTVMQHSPLLKDSAQYTYKNNILIIKRPDGFNYLLNVTISNDSLVLSEIPVPLSMYKRTFHYSK